MRSPWGGTGREPSADCPSNDPTDVGKHQQRRKLSAQRDGGADVQGCAGQTDANTILDVRRRRTASHPVATEQTEQKTRNRADPRSKALRKGLRGREPAGRAEDRHQDDERQYADDFRDDGRNGDATEP